MKFRRWLSLVVPAALFSMLLSTGAYAEGTTERTVTLDLAAAEFANDQANAAEGWSWTAATCTLTLNNVNFNVDSGKAINVPGMKNVTFVLNGTNTVTSSTVNIATISRDLTASETTGLTITGEGTLNVVHRGQWNTFDQSNLTLQSGTLNVTGGTILTLQVIRISGGTLNIDTSAVPASGASDGLYAAGGIEITGGTVNINSNETALWCTGARANPATGISITGGDITLYGPLAAIRVSKSRIEPHQKDIYLAGASIDFKNSPVAIASSYGNITVDRGTYKVSQVTTRTFLSSVNTTGIVTIADADYAAVDAQLARIPADLSICVESTVPPVTAARDAVVTGKNTFDQETVDTYAANLKTAIDNLQYKPAEYAAVDAALAKIPADLSVFTGESAAALDAARTAVVTGKGLNEQTTVDGYAAALEAAIAGLTYRPADYAAVDAALAKIPADLSVYTDGSAAALNAARKAVVTGKTVVEQAAVDGYAAALEAAIAGLTYKPADYAAVDAALAKIPADLTGYTDASVGALNAARAAVAGGMNAAGQNTVNGWAASLEAALAALQKKPAAQAAPNTGDGGALVWLAGTPAFGLALAGLYAVQKRRRRNG